MEIIDSHCHLDHASFDPDRDRVLRRCRELGVVRIVVPGVAAAGWDGLLALCRSQPALVPALGLHPVFLDRHRRADLDRLDHLLADPAVVAVGEIGLDFFVRELDRARQLELFEAQLGLAAQHRLPVLLHVRKAHDQVLACLRRQPVRGGIAHAFNGSREQAEQYLALGFKLGFGGMLTYPRARRIRALAAGLPVSALVLETDAPDMTLASHRGERNSPEYLPQCLAALAGLRPEPIEELAGATNRNLRAILEIE